MTDNEVARLALANQLRKSAQLYLAAVAGTAVLGRFLEDLAAERISFATEILPSDEASGLPTEAELDDARRRSESGEREIGELVYAEEQRLQHVVEDLPEDCIAPELAGRIVDSAAASRRNLLNSLMTLRASAERPRSDSTGLVIGWMDKGTPAVVKPPVRIYRVWYGTDRAPRTNAGKLVGYSGERGDAMRWGICDVAIPRSHEVGSTGSPWWHRIVRDDDRLKLSRLDVLAEADFWQSVRARISATTQPGDAIVFLHGYNCTFEEAAVRAAQIGADLTIPGAMAFFSWPSRGRVLRYFADEAAIEASEAAIVSFLSDFATQSGARAIHVIAHSMGNRGLLRAVQRIAANAAQATGRTFNQIILAAPDVDAGAFRQLAGAYGLVADRTTLYVSSGDLAVRASRLLHSHDRVGFVPPVAIVNGIETVNVMGVDLTLMGHGYVGECRSVLMDMHELMVRGTPPADRAMLRALTDATGRPFWEIAA